MNKLTKRLLLVVILVIIIVAGFCFYYGFILNKESKPKNVYHKIIDKINDNFTDYFKLDKDYILGDNFEILGEIDFNLDGTYYLKNSVNHPEDIKIYNKINNLTNATTTYKYIQNNEEDRLLKEINQKINDEDILLNKVLVENVTEYTYVSGVTDKYINNGNNIYFETIDGTHTTKDNMDYLYEFILESLKNSLLDSYFEKEEKKIAIDGELKNTYQMSLRIDDSRLKEIVNYIVKDIKSDERANDIVCSIDRSFEKYKVKDNDRFLEKDEAYTINIYTDKVWFSPIKYEVIHLKNSDRDSYTYIGDLKGRLTYIHNDDLKYNVDVQINHKTYLFEFSNVSSKKIGKIKLDKYDKMYSLDIDLNLDNKSYKVTYSRKIKDVKKNKSFKIDDLMKIKFSENDIVRFNGDIKNTIKFSNNNKIKEEVNDVVLRSSLTDVEESNYNNIKERLIERLER